MVLQATKGTYVIHHGLEPVALTPPRAHCSEGSCQGKGSIVVSKKIENKKIKN